MESNQTKLLVGLGVGLCLPTVAYYIHQYYKQKKNNTPPSKWKRVGTLQNIYIYPIKSCAPVELSTSHCEELGLSQGYIKDRALMLVDSAGVLVSARVYPKMFKITSEMIGASKIIISAPGMDTKLEFDFSTPEKLPKETLEVDLHKTIITAIDCGPKYHAWFSQFILGSSEGLRLVFYPYATSTRPIVKEFNNGVFTKRDTGAFQDVTSYMLINSTSVADLSKRVNKHIHPLQFRSSFVIEGTGGPNEEDHWKWIKIGDGVLFRIVTPCYRCIMPNIDPYTAERDPDGEPLKTLKKYRMFPSNKKSPVMGVQMGLRASGFVKTGDAIYVEDA